MKLPRRQDRLLFTWLAPLAACLVAYAVPGFVGSAPAATPARPSKPGSS